jgi:predicted AAA+ superfamily ATPase
MINRILYGEIKAKLNKGKAIIITGARQTGKTTLVRQLADEHKNNLFFNSDEPDTSALFESPSSSRLRNIFGDRKLIIIDEAQRIPDIGIKLKLITDSIKNVQVVATGSSSFELADKINEPLTGRKWEYQLFPVSFAEMVGEHGLQEEARLLPQRMVYGYYPEVLNNPGNEKEILRSITDSYLYKDILMWERIKKPEKLVKLLQALAYQVGSQVSYNELGQTISADHQTVEKYIQLLEKVFVIFRIGSLSRNLRHELKMSRKIYFYDNGIRNSVIAAFNPPEIRQDAGALWENFIMAERTKHIHYSKIWVNRFFWRTHEQQEIDYIEEMDGKYFAFEFKWSTKRQSRLSKTFIKAYPNHEYLVITPENYHEFICEAIFSETK